MKVAHLTACTTSGMMVSTIEEVAAEVRAGVDARLVYNSGSHVAKEVPLAGPEFIQDADICVIHSGATGGDDCLGKPFFFVAHGSPQLCFRLERLHSFTAYSIPDKIINRPNCEGIITYYENHVPFWQNLAPDGKVFFIPPSVDLDKWCPGPAVPGIFGERAGDINIVSTARWREADDPFEAVNAVFHFAKLYPDKKVRLHLYGVGGSWAGLVPLLNHLHRKGLLGVNMPMSDRLVDVYRSADMCITNHKANARTVRECLACGCQLVGDEQLKVTPYRASRDCIPAYVEAMRRAYQGILDIPVKRKNLNRIAAEDNFNPGVKATRYIELYERALAGREVAVC